MLMSLRLQNAREKIGFIRFSSTVWSTEDDIVIELSAFEALVTPGMFFMSSIKEFRWI